jgi:putative ABC transport system permease protein
MGLDKNEKEDTVFKTYLKIAARNINRHKGYAFINISSLAIGIACFILLFVYVFFELGFDRYHENADRIYRLGRVMKMGDDELREPMSNASTAKFLRSRYPEVEDVARFGFMGRIPVKYKDKLYYENGIRYADPSVFSIFTFPMIGGDPQTCLDVPYSVVITEDMAEKYFGEQNPIGEVMKFNNQYDFHVTGVMKNLPENTHFDFDMLCSFNTLVAQKTPNLDDWMSFKNQTYVLLKENTDPASLERKFPAFIAEHMNRALAASGSKLEYFLHPLTKIYLYSHLEGYPPGRITNVYWNIILAFLILSIACINFMNLTTARSADRVKEVGMRKVTGAVRFNLIKQFLGEALFYSFLSLFAAVVLVELTLPILSSITGTHLSIDYLGKPGWFLGFILLAVGVGVIAGSYPAFYLSAFQPVGILKGGPLTGVKKSRFRNFLVVLQFTSSIVFIYYTFIISNQLDFMKSKNLGFDKKNVVVMPAANHNLDKAAAEYIKTELRKCEGVTYVSVASEIPRWNFPRSEKLPQGFSRNEGQVMDELYVDHDYIPLMGIKMASGRNFARNSTADRIGSIIINETAAKKFGWENPIGKTIQYSAGKDELLTGTVIGVVKDFHHASLYRIIVPLFIGNNTDNFNYILARIKPGNIKRTMENLEKTWKTIDPDRPFDYFFLEDFYDSTHRTVERIRDVMSFFAVFSLFIACLGIFSLAAFTAEKRTKEVGIRKVVGATTSSIIIRLNRQLMKLVVIAIILAFLFTRVPSSVMDRFFPYHANIGIILFFKVALLVFVIALATISYQSIRIGRSNPVEALRYE